MILSVGLDQPAGIDMGIDLGGIDAGVPQKALHYPYTYSRFQKMGGKRVPKGMGTHIPLDSGFDAGLAQNLPKAHAGKLIAKTVQKEDIGLLFFEQYIAVELQVLMQQGIQGFQVGHIALFTAFTPHQDHGLFKMQIVDSKSQKL